MRCPVAGVARRGILHYAQGMETTEGNTMKLTRNQRKMVIEHAAQECADALPADDTPDFWKEYDKVVDEHWMRLMMKLETAYYPFHAAGWLELVEFIRSADQLDRDPAGHLYALGEDDTEQNREFWKDHYNMTIGANIDI